MKLTLSPLTRTIAFLTVFAIGSAIFTILLNFIPHRSTVTPYVVFGIFAFIGSFFLSEQTPTSRLASTFTLIFLAAIAMRFGRTVIPASFLLLLVGAASYVGSLPYFHRKLSSTKQATLTNIVIVSIGLISVGIFTYVETLLERVASY